MKFKGFQEAVLARLSKYLTALSEQAARSAKQVALAAEHPDAGIQVADFTANAWETMRAAGELPTARQSVPFSPRTSGAGQPVPSICLKVPTGGGKTLLAAASVSRILDKWQGRRTGFVLWVCPNEAIYSQTRRALRDREHPYRHMLDQASGGRTRILEKDDPLSRADVDGNLCVMLLMLQSANRETKESLRLFRDRGNVHGFFPAADDRDGHACWLQDVPNLDHYSDVTMHWHVVKDSLGNALRAIRPIVVLDEGHKGYSKLAMDTLYGFNPSFVLELSATPADRPKDSPPVYSNWLCDVRGTDLDAEDMIKLPINVAVKAGKDWRACLRESLAQLDALQAEAERLHADCARYIRPICLVQVERTGKDQRDGAHVHSEDAFDYLLTLGLREDQIAIKSAERDDLKGPERQDLTSPTNSVRFIITKSALQEGWDCPFAYVLCSLASVSSKGAMTQLIGRILRQPDTEKTGIASLDECYVLCVHSKTKDVIAAIKNGLEQDGMGDLATQVKTGDGSDGNDATAMKRRKGMESLRIFLPLVRWVEEGRVRDLDYEMDLLWRTDPLAIDMAPLAKRLATGDSEAASQFMRIGLAGGQQLLQVQDRDSVAESPGFDPVHACRAISDLVPNAWQARVLVDMLLIELVGAGVDEAEIGERAGLIIDQLRLHLESALDVMAEAVFRDEIAAGHVQFSLHTDGRNYQVPDTFDAMLAKPLRGLVRDEGMQVEKSLFVPATEDGLNGLERNVACYVDGKAATHWWFRNVARSQYGLQGWRKHKVYPDLVVAVRQGGANERVLVLETKGQHLDNPDSRYKRDLLDLLSVSYSGQVVGDMALDLGDDRALHCELVLENDWQVRLAALIK